MKKIIFTILVIIFLMGELKSQEILPMAIGPYISFAGGVNANDVPKGRKNGFTFSNLPDFGLNYYLPFTKTANLGLSLDLSYSTYPYQMKNYYTSTPYDFYFHYFEINPSVFFSGFTFGFNVSIPMMGEIDNGVDFTDDLNTTYGLHLGGVIPIFSNETGRVNFIIEGNYAFSGTYKDYNITNDPMTRYAPPETPLNDALNPRNGSVSIGFSYLFHLTKPQSFDTETGEFEE